MIRTLTACILLAVLIGCTGSGTSPRAGGHSFQQSGPIGAGIQQSLTQSEDPAQGASARQDRERVTDYTIPAGGTLERGFRTLPQGITEDYHRTHFPSPSVVTSRESESSETTIGGTFDFSKVYQSAARNKHLVTLYLIAVVLISIGGYVAIKTPWKTPGAFIAGSGVLLIVLFEYIGAVAWIALILVAVALIVKLANELGEKEGESH